MIKSLKTVAKELAVHESGHLVLLALFDLVDDTVLVNKSIFSELQQHVFDLAVHKFGRIPLLYPFVGRRNRLLPPPAIASIQELDKFREVTRYQNWFLYKKKLKKRPTDHNDSKKDPEVRQSELRNHLSPIVLQGVADHSAELVRDSFGCQFATEVLLGSSGTYPPHFTPRCD